MKYLKTYEAITNKYYEDSKDPSEFIEGFIVYNNYVMLYKVEHHQDFGYAIDEVECGDADVDNYIDENWDDIKNEIIKDIKKGKRATNKEIEEIKKEMKEIRIKKISKNYNL